MMFDHRLAIARSKIQHRRYAPKAHHFEAELSYLCFDPDQLEPITQASWLWSMNKCNILSLKAGDFLTGYHGNIRTRLARVLMQFVSYSLKDPEQIRVLALPRTLGFRFNSVVFYFIADAQQQPLFIVSEITNTPWNERKVYVHDCRKQPQVHGDYQHFQFDFAKSFHVSPFMPMDLHYRWHFSFSAHDQFIHMQLLEQEKLVFDASMQFRLQPITVPSQQHIYAIRSVLEPFKMVGLIYLQAFRLWSKKIPFYRHPKKIKDIEAR